MREKVLEILCEMRPDVDFEKQSNFVSGEILTSFDIVVFVAEVAETLGIDIKTKYLKAENFNTIDDIVRIVEASSEGIEK